jgi:7-cyano-7-deazaguanine synthase
VPRKKKSIGVLFSGGLDSGALIGSLLKKGFDVWPIYTQAGLPWEKIEFYWARKFLRSIRSPRLHPLRRVRLLLEQAYQNNWSLTGKTPGFNSPDDEVFLPARNLLLITKAFLFLSWLDINTLAIATLEGNPFPDGKPSYFRMLEKVLSQSFARRIQIRTPFRNISKQEVIKRSPELPWHLTFSCISPEGTKHCGRCNKCAERQRAFKQAGISDRTVYARG